MSPESIKFTYMNQNINSQIDEEYPTYEQAGSNKQWDDMTELEKAYYNLRKCKNALVVARNTIQRYRSKTPNTLQHKNSTS
jgi:hypothetical protein